MVHYPIKETGELFKVQKELVKVHCPHCDQTIGAIAYDGKVQGICSNWSTHSMHQPFTLNPVQVEAMIIIKES
jgi:transposase-like protein